MSEQDLKQSQSGFIMFKLMLARLKINMKLNSSSILNMRKLTPFIENNSLK